MFGYGFKKKKQNNNDAVHCVGRDDLSLILV